MLQGGGTLRGAAARLSPGAFVAIAGLLGCGPGGAGTTTGIATGATTGSASAATGTGGAGTSSSAGTGGVGGAATTGTGGMGGAATAATTGTGGGGLCAPGTTQPCYSGPPGTQGVGICAAGVETCNAQGTAYGSCVGEITPQPESCATPVDDNCDGQVNEGCVCVPGSTSSCYSGPTGTEGVGACVGGTHTCDAQGLSYGSCMGEITPQPESCATPADDNCDGQVNEGCVCVPGSTSSCYTGPMGTEGVGACAPGTHTCDAQGLSYGSCMGEITPQPESCATPADDNCDGQVNEGCVCVPGSTSSCYSGPTGTAGVGACVAGTHTCDAQGLSYGPCMGEVTPQPESCATPVDDNCDGQINEGCVCVPGSTSSCYSGPTGTAGVGACVEGTHTCDAQGLSYGPCMGDVTPQPESCSTPVDDNCDGQINEGCVCAPSSTSSCYSGPAGTQGVGICQAGTHTCDAQGHSYGPCMGEITPQLESCSTAVDDNCDGQINEGCVCVPGSTSSCYTGPMGTEGVGACVGGTHTCDGLGHSYGPCMGEITPQPESCSTAVDDNCDGQINEGCVCAPSSTSSCYTGPMGTQGVGVCMAGTQTCNAQGTAYGPCAGQVTPQPESCNTPADDDCNGQTNEICGLYGWSGAWGGTTDDEGFALAADTSGNVILGGYINGTADFGCGPLVTGGNWDTSALVKFSPTGSCLWSKRAGTAQTHIISAATDPASNVYVIGYFLGTLDLGCGAMISAGVADAFVAKLGPSGTCVWSNRYGNASNQNGYDLALDSGGNVYITGFFNGGITFGGNAFTSSGGTDIFLAKLSPSGVPVWSKTFGDAANQIGNGVVVDGSDNVILAGTFSGSVDFGGGVLASAGLGDAFVAKFTSAGAHVWSARFGDGADQNGTDVKVDAAGNVFLAGNNAGSMTFGSTMVTTAGGTDAFLAKLSAAGTPLWAKDLGGAATQTGVGIAVDGAGNVAMTGSLNGTTDFGGGPLTSAGSVDVYVAKYDPTGAHLWSRRFGDPANQTPRGMGIDGSGNLLVTGFLQGPTDFGGGAVVGGGGEDIFLVKLTP